MTFARAFAGSLVLTLCACGDDDAGGAAPALEAQLAGCAEVHRGPRCLLTEDARSIVFWSELAEGTPVRVRSGDTVLPVSQAYVEGGIQIRVDVPRDAEALVVEAFEGERVTGAFTLPIGETSTPAPLARAAELRASGDFDEAEALATPLLEDPDPAVANAAKSFLGRLALSRGDTERAVELLGEASEAHFARGNLSAATNDALAQAHTLSYEQWDFAGAETALERAAVRSAGYDEGAAAVPYYRAQLASELSQFRTASSEAQTAEQLATRLDLRWLRGLAVQLRATVLQHTGRFSDAASLLGTIRDETLRSGESCERANYLTTVGWALLLDADSASSSSRLRTTAVRDDPRQPLDAALRELETSCNRRSDIGNVSLNLAFAALQRDDLDSARVHLTRAREHLPEATASVAAWTAEIEARIAARDDRTRHALTLYESLIARASAAGALDAEWRARLGRARVLADAEQREAALTELAHAEEALDVLTQRIALGDGRDSFAGDRDATARLLVDLQLDADPAAAATAARRARLRALRSMHRAQRLAHLEDDQRAAWAEAVGTYWRVRNEQQARADSAWELPGREVEELAAAGVAGKHQLSALLDRAFAILGPPPHEALGQPAPGEVWLVYFPLVEGWAAIAVTRSAARGVRTTFSRDASRAQMSASLLEPLRTEIESATSARVLAYGPTDEVSFATLPWGTGTLVDALPVEHGLDVPREPRDPNDDRVLIVADPRGDLPAAMDEAEAVSSLLRSSERAIEVIARDAARPDRIRQAMRDVGLLHYAGHGRHAGRGSWESSLPLAGDTELTVGDVLALPEVPREVVLSACEAGRADDASSGAPGISLARAFVAAGAQHVVAAVRPVPDEVAARFAVAYHRARLSRDPAEAFRSALLELRETDPEHVSTYRMFVP